MVVIIMIGIILSFATLSIGDGNLTQKLEQESKRFTYLLELASQEAIIQSKDMGVKFDVDSYSFCELQTEINICATCKIINDGIFKPRILPVGIEIEMNLDGEPVFSNCKNIPQLLILSSGEFTPFEITFSSERLIYQLAGNLIGEITVLTNEKE